MAFPTAYVLQERGWSFVARGVFDTEAAAHKAAAAKGLKPGNYEVQPCDYYPHPSKLEESGAQASLPDSTPRAEVLREQAQIALTAVQYTQDEDEARGSDAMNMLFESYSREEINEGGMLALTVMLAYEARELGIPLAERVQAVRKLLREGFVFAIEDDEDEEGPQ